MEEDNIMRPTHKFLFPYGQSVCGKAFPMTMEATLECERLDSGEGEYLELKVITLTGTCSTGRVYNMMMLIEANDEVTQCIMECIVGNEKYWDVDAMWWQNNYKG